MAKTKTKTKTETKTKKASAKVIMDQRSGERRKTSENRKKATPVKSEKRETGERREKVNRRRQIDPTTCEREYTDPELEFMHALDEYKRQNGRMFPTCSEILEVIGSLGYAKPGSPAPVPAPVVSSESDIETPLLSPSEN